MAPTTQKQWTVKLGGDFEGMQFNANAPVQKPGNHQVLVNFHAASLNYRDLIIAKNKYPFAVRDGVVPASDGAGVVAEVGPNVTQFKVGDHVATLFNQEHQGGPLTPFAAGSGVGGVIDGALQEYGLYAETGLVKIPQNLSMVEASTLSCAALTAWNALYGVESKQLKPGNWVLTQGTGGVSVFALQLAKAAGAKVISTTSSKDKGDMLKKLGADHVLNYREDKSWGETAKKLTKNGEGVDHIIEVGGPGTMAQSLKAIKLEGIISVIGFLGGTSAEESPSTLAALTSLCTIRGILVGSRVQFEDMNRAIEANDIHPVVDKTVFNFDQVKEAYQHQWDQKHFGKVVIKVSKL